MVKLLVLLIDVMLWGLLLAEALWLLWLAASLTYGVALIPPVFWLIAIFKGRTHGNH